MRDSGSLNEPTVLVVDDDPDLRKLMVLGLHRGGFETRQAASGEEALTLLKGQSVDGVVLDVGMPGMSGIDVVTALRGDPDTATLPILLITGSGDHDTVLLALEAGADDFLSKPVRLDELVARIRAHLRTSDAWTNQVASELRARANLVGVLGGLALSSEPDDAAAALVAELGRSAGCEFVGVLQMADHGRLNVLATYNGVAGVQRGGTLSSDRARYMLSRVRDGPWVEIVGSRLRDESTNAFWSAGLELAAGAPIYAGSRVVGVLITGQAGIDPASTPARQARLLAAVIDYANILSVAAGASIAHHRRMTATRARLERVIATRAFYAVFQPIVELVDHRVTAYEALTRFTDGTPPEVRFAEATEHGLGVDLEAAAIQSALHAAGSLPVPAPICLNAPPALVLDRERVMSFMDIAPQPIILELTEHARIEDYEALREALSSYGSGVRLAIDDAGAGYSSLRHILELRPAFVKLDLSIVRGIEADPVRQALVSGLVYFAGKTGSELIAEGVETDAEAEILVDLGIRFGQGFLLGRPAPVA
jgi:EAL domain-containing protein (putative c-di-GMP-specific phosphodiesterase class I)/FixJ family two-component response regulator